MNEANSGPTLVGPWLVEQTADGPALRRTDPATHPESVDPDWDPVEFVPGAGAARRVVVLGESTARGWPFEHVLSPTSVLADNLAELDSYQCVDLSKVGADGDLLATIAAMLPIIRPDVVVSLAGNNWTMPPPTGAVDAHGRGGPFDGLASALRSGGYSGLRAAGLERATSAARRYLERLLHLHRSTGARIVMAITEFNLAGFQPPHDIQTPVLPRTSLQRWHELNASATRALADGDTGSVTSAAIEMSTLDGGCSPVPGWLAGHAAIIDGDGVRARAALEQSRDAVIGLLLRYTPRTARAIQDLILSFAEEHGFDCVDLRTVLADPSLPDLPDPRCFHDYCHLSEIGILRAVSAITDAVAGLTAGTTRPGSELPAPARAFGHARAAVHLAFQAQPRPIVTSHIDAALAEEPALVTALTDVRDILSAPAPAWTAPAMGRLVADPQVGPFVGAVIGRPGLAAELWTLRGSLDDTFGVSPVQNSASPIDLLAEPEPDGHPLPNWTEPRAHHVSCSSDSDLAFGLSGHCALELTFELRTRWALPDGQVVVSCNGTELCAVAADRTWRRNVVKIPAGVTRTGINHIRLHWPVPDQDLAKAIEDDAAALDRGSFPMVLPVFGEVYEAEVRVAVR